MFNRKRSFLDRLTGKEEESEEINKKLSVKKDKDNWIEEENEEAELTVDIFQTDNEIVVQTMVAGVKPEDIELTISRDMITVKGRREINQNINEDDYFTKELYWGSFSRTILLPQEIDAEEAEATEKHGLLTVRLPKIDKEKKRNIKIKSI
jgi:HSP20 family molecular chaperone IbpA